MAAANENQWLEFWQRLEVHGDALLPWSELQTAYTEPWRAYHNLKHIGHCLAEFAAVRQLAEDPIAIEAAIWFHDVVYDTHRKHNEERSAESASTALAKAGKSNRFCGYVHTLILATRHQSQPTSKDARLLADIDLSILGQDPSVTPHLSSRFAASMPVGDNDFATGRSAVLKTFHERESIYATCALKEKYETQARRNLAWAIKRLAGYSK